MKRPNQIAIVGAGISGMATAYFLSDYSNVEIYLIEAGRAGIGSQDILSGTAGPYLPALSKMISTGFIPHYNPKITTPTLEGFIELHGLRNTDAYFEACKEGKVLLKSICETVSPQAFKQDGGLYIACSPEDVSIIDHEMQACAELFGKWEKSLQISSKVIQQNFKLPAFIQDGHFLSQDAIVSSNQIIDGLKKYLKKRDNVFVLENTRLKEVNIRSQKVFLETEHEVFDVDYIILATAGFYKDHNLIKAIGGNIWSFILSYPDTGPATPNVNILASRTKPGNRIDPLLDNGIYLTRQQGVLAIGGQDQMVTQGNFGCPNKQNQSIRNIAELYNRFFAIPGELPVQPIYTHYGVYSYSQDGLPILGKFNKGDRVFYLSLCNGVGHGLLALGASLIPYILGLSSASDKEDTFIRLFSPQRDSLQGCS